MGDSGFSDGGRIPGLAGQPAYHLAHAGHESRLPVLIAVPHAGRAYPVSLRENMRSPTLATLRLEDRLADLVAETVAKETGASLLVAMAPRAMIDLNRDPDDVDWDMVAEGAPLQLVRKAAGRRARSGLGLVPRRLPGLGEIWKRRMRQADLQARIDDIHRPYHSVLSDTLESLRDRWGGAILVDLHSMPPLGRKTGVDAAPDFVIGDRFGSSCSSTLSGAALDHFEQCGRKVAHNRPYAGGYVLDRHGKPARGVHALQVEICRSAYLDAAMVEPGKGLGGVTQVLSGLVRRLSDELSGNAGAWRHAAE